MFANTEGSFTVFLKTILAMESSVFEFFLTGSRFFGNVTPFSDYDFFVEEEIGVEDFLKNLGFHLVVDQSYDGDLYYSKVFTLGEGNEKIQVQLIHSDLFEQKHTVQRLLKTIYPFGLPGNRDTKKQLWYLARQMLKELAIS